MSNDSSLVLQNSIVPAIPAHESTTAEEAIDLMLQLIQASFQNVIFQNPQGVDSAARLASTAYDEVKQIATPTELFLLGVMRDTVHYLATLTRSMAFLSEGRFAKAREELTKGLAALDNAQANMDKYMRLPEKDDALIKAFQPLSILYVILRVFFRAFDITVQADVLGYQGKIGDYIRLLSEAVTMYRSINELPLSRDPMTQAFAAFCTNYADRLETRIEVFSKHPEQRYISHTGEKVFLIHGHDAAAWRELRDLLEKRLKVQTLVLIEEPSAGETLIHKFETYADNCGYAFALFTPDDFVKKNNKVYFQARPNVLFELGWFYGHFGRERVCIVKKANTEIPSDLAGILSIDYHDKLDEGFTQIQDELIRAGIIGPKKRKPRTARTTRRD